MWSILADCLALALAAAACGNGEGTEDDGTSGQTAPPASSPSLPAAPPDINLELAEFWEALPPTCDATEVEISQPPELAGVVRVCQPDTGENKPRYLNISDTSLSLTYDPTLAVTSYHGAAENDPLTRAALGIAQADARENPQTGLFILPSHEAVTIDGHDETAPSPQVTIEPNPDHTEKVLSVRTAADLFGQLPWNDLGDSNVVGTKVAGCALGALAMVQQNEVPSLDDAFGQAQACQEAAEEISDAWQRRQAAAAPAAEDVLQGLSRGARQGNAAVNEIRQFARQALSALARF